MYFMCVAASIMRVCSACVYFWKVFQNSYWLNVAVFYCSEVISDNNNVCVYIVLCPQKKLEAYGALQYEQQQKHSIQQKG